MKAVERFKVFFDKFISFNPKRNKIKTFIFVKDSRTGKEYELTCCLGIMDLAADLGREFGYEIAYSPCDFEPLNEDATEEEAYDCLSKIRRQVQSDVASAVLFEKSREIIEKIEQTAEKNKIKSSTIRIVVEEKMGGYGSLFSDVMDDIIDEVEGTLVYNGYEIID